MTGPGFKPLGKQMSLIELKERARAGITDTIKKLRMWGTTVRRVRKRMILSDGRHMHPTKGIAKSERGGYNRRSRRSNS